MNHFRVRVRSYFELRRALNKNGIPFAGPVSLRAIADGKCPAPDKEHLLPAHGDGGAELLALLPFPVGTRRAFGTHLTIGKSTVLLLEIHVLDGPGSNYSLGRRRARLDRKSVV